MIDIKLKYLLNNIEYVVKIEANSLSIKSIRIFET